jgi:hypothetical protein
MAQGMAALLPDSFLGKKPLDISQFWAHNMLIYQFGDFSGGIKMKQKEERDLENALAWDGKPGNMDAALEAARIDEEEPKRFFREAGQTLVRGSNPNLLCYRRKRVNANFAKHWFIYEYPDRQEVRLLTCDQRINGERYGFGDAKDQPVFSYS